MCGIIGRINYNEAVDKELFNEMRDELAHRGPDGFGSFFSEDGKIALGHRRLSFLDLTVNGVQPICNENAGIWLSVNGEIYNYKELRKTLIEKGHVFKSESDSEVILHGYEEWGVDVLQHLKGMFAFGLWDEKKKTLLLARDRFGIKPLYYYRGKDSFIFASEIKAIVKDNSIIRQLNYQSFADFFVYRYVPSPHSIWENIYKLPPAHYLVIEDNVIGEVKPYWNLKSEQITLSEKEAVEKTHELLINAVKTHIQSEVPIGSFLSGGYDSSALVYYMSLLHYPTSTFAIGFDSWKESEHLYAEMVADTFHTDHKSLIIDGDALADLSHLAYVYDEPIADISIVPTYRVSRLAASNVKAVLSGEGADELFGGYTWHKEYVKKVNARNGWVYLLNKLTGMNRGEGVQNYSRAMAMGLFDLTQLRELLNPDVFNQTDKTPFSFYKNHFKKEFTPLKQFQYLDIKTFMGELVLTKVDRASMANSLEVRVPFLDQNLVEFLFNLKENIYFKPEQTKFLLRENIKNHMPPQILQRKKQGFVGPDIYYQNIHFYRNHLADSVLVKDKLINVQKLENMFLTKDYWRLWKVLIMELWYKRWCRK
ncbi:MAG: asparagine synthase (glutamine-hydrolyzing) [Bacteroidales bacterium]|nr:asparagine synthase (glutamine-hydrolyzing) [Bacteroidales bacterium]